MHTACDSCETQQFCEDIGRCLNAALYKGFGEAEVDDSVQELTADDFAGIKKITISSKPGKLSDEEISILKQALK